MKNWHVVVMLKYKTIFQKQCSSVADANKLLAEKKLEYPAPHYVTKEEF